MARWEPNAHERLQHAAMELFHERGYDHTTVGDIAARAGLTERTFFRYFTDKREVLFAGAKDLEALIVTAIAAAPTDVAALDTVVLGLAATAPGFEPRRAYARRRQTLITAHPELHERELIKLAALATAIATSLHHRGLPRPAASLVAETGIALFKHAFERWVDDPRKHDLAHHLQAALAELRVVTAPAARAPRRRARSA